MTPEAKSRLIKLLEIISPSMQEEKMMEHLAHDWKRIAPYGKVSYDVIGNMEFSCVKNSSFKTVALVAHADTVCIQLTQCIGHGKYRFRSIGVSPYMLLGQPVVIINENGDTVEGVIGFDATSQYGQPKGLIFEDLWVDIPDEAKHKYITVGDLAVLKPRYSFHENGLISATGLDDRLGLYIIGEVLRKYVRKNLPVNLVCVSTVQEEVGLRGSAGFKFTSHPDAVIVLDVDYATDVPVSHEDQMGRLYVNAGPGVQRKADNSPYLRMLLQHVAHEKELPVQMNLGRFLYGGTDSSSLQTDRSFRGNVIANLSIPCRYMHSPVELASINDVCHAVEIIAGVMEVMSEKDNMHDIWI